MLIHVIAEIAKKSNLLVESCRIILKLMIMFNAVSLYVMDVPMEKKKNKTY